MDGSEEWRGVDKNAKSVSREQEKKSKKYRKRAGNAEERKIEQEGQNHKKRGNTLIKTTRLKRF